MYQTCMVSTCMGTIHACMRAGLLHSTRVPHPARMYHQASDNASVCAPSLPDIGAVSMMVMMIMFIKLVMIMITVCEPLTGMVLA